MRWLIALKRKDIDKTPVDYRHRGIQSKRRQVGSATNKKVTRRNGDNRIGDNSVISATDKIKMAKKQHVKTATTIEEEEGREKKRREEERRKRITN